MAPRKSTLSHVDPRGRPRMVDVSAKAVTLRTAVAECRLDFPAAIAAALHHSGWRSAKGPVLDTATVAGVMAAKRTHELIPFCHPLALERCEIRSEFVGARGLRIECEAGITGKTGVEMEALVGATVAALTVYDMVKALGQGTIIRGARLLSKHGGKREYRARAR